MAKDNYIMRSDDGKLYRVSTDDLFAHPLPPNDPSAKYASDLKTLASKLSAGADSATPFACIIALVEHPQSGSPGRKD